MRTFLIRSVVLLALGLLAACGGSNDAPEAPNASPTPDPTSDGASQNPRSSTSADRPLADPPVAIINATVVDGLGEVIKNASLLMADGKITAIGADLTVPDGMATIDAQGRWVTPGIIDIQARVSMSPADPRFDAIRATGVTTVHVTTGSPTRYDAQGVTLRTVPARTLQAMMFPNAPATRTLTCADGFGRTAGSSGRSLTPDRAPHMSAPEDDPPVYLDCAHAEDIAQALARAERQGVRIAAIHHAVEGYKIADHLANAGTCAAASSDLSPMMAAALDAIVENIPLVHAAGGCAIVHSGHGGARSVAPRLNHDIARSLAAARRAGLDITEGEAWTWLSLNPARALGVDQDVGSLEPGKRADVVVWSGDPFSVYTVVDQVYLDGAVVFDRNNPARQPLSDGLLGQATLEARP